MIWKNQPQMIERAGWHIMRKLDLDDDQLEACEEAARAAFHYAFAAIDRERLIEEAACAYYDGVREECGIRWEHVSEPVKELQLKGAERSLVAIGIIPR